MSKGAKPPPQAPKATVLPVPLYDWRRDEVFARVQKQRAEQMRAEIWKNADKQWYLPWN